MNLAEILDLDRVCCDVVVASKKRSLEEIAKLLALGALDIDPSDILNGLAGREKLGSTGLGHGIAIPHTRMNGIETSTGALIRLRHPIEYDSHDSQPVDMIFGLLVPQQATGEHLQHLASIAEKFSDDEFCEKARAAADAAALHALIAA